MVQFAFIPDDLRVPGVYAEIDNSRAVRGQLPQFTQRVLLMGQRLAAGTVAEAAAVSVQQPEDAATFFGRGSQLHRMFQAFSENNDYTEVIAIALDDAGAGVAASGSIDFTGSSPTEAGTLNVYIGGRRVRIAVATTDTPATLATALAAAITAVTDIAVTAATATNVVNLTARNKGENGNDIDVRLNYYEEDRTPSGVAAAITAMNGGTGNPDIATLIAAIGDEQYEYMVSPWTDAANLTALETALAARWQPLNENEGHAFSAAAGTQAALTTLGNGRNSPHVSIAGIDSSPTPPEEIAAAFCAVAAFHLNQDPARPLQRLPLTGVMAPAVADRFTLAERQILLFDGITTLLTDRVGVVMVERAITTYQTNAGSAPDPSYLDVTTLATVAFLRRSWRVRMAQVFDRYKLAADGTAFAPGSAVATPSMIWGETVSLARQWEQAGLIENLDQFKEELVVEINGSDPTRVDLLIPPNLVNGLRIIAGVFQYIL